MLHLKKHVMRRTALLSALAIIAATGASAKECVASFPIGQTHGADFSPLGANFGVSGSLLTATNGRFFRKNNFGSYVGELVTVVQDDREAKALMEEAGYSASNKLKIEMLLRENHIFYPIASAFADMLRQGYFDVAIRSGGAGQTYYGYMDRRDFDLALFMWTTQAQYAEPSLIALRAVLDKQISDDEFYARMRSRLVAAQSAPDRAEFFRLLAQVESELTEAGFIIPLYELPVTAVYRRRLAKRSLSSSVSGYLRHFYCAE